MLYIKQSVRVANNETFPPQKRGVPPEKFFTVDSCYNVPLGKQEKVRYNEIQIYQKNGACGIVVAPVRHKE